MNPKDLSIEELLIMDIIAERNLLEERNWKYAKALKDLELVIKKYQYDANILKHTSEMIETIERVLEHEHIDY